MKRIVVGLMCALMLSGCAVFTPDQAAIDTTRNRDVFMACSAADSITTYAILSNGGHELNPLLSGLAKSIGPAHFLVFGLGIGLVVYLIWDHLPKPVQTTTTVVECGAAIHNVFVM